MTIVISGYGKMGRMVETVALENGLEIALKTEDVASVPDEIAKDCICIDFTTPEAFRANYKILASKFRTVVVGTTGWDDIREDVFKAFRDAGKTLIWSSNFSIGVNAYFAAIERISSILRRSGYIPRIEEIHHIHKLDAPSGTAKSIAAIIEEEMRVYPKIDSQRIGEVPGTHITEFVSEVDKITFTHEAFSRKGFAQGAVYAAMRSRYLWGIFEFKDIIIDD